MALDGVPTVVSGNKVDPISHSSQSSSQGHGAKSGSSGGGKERPGRQHKSAFQGKGKSSKGKAPASARDPRRAEQQQSPGDGGSSQTPGFPDFFVETCSATDVDTPPTLLWCFEAKTYDKYQHHLGDHACRPWRLDEDRLQTKVDDPRVQAIERFLECRCDLEIGFAMFCVGPPLNERRQSFFDEDRGDASPQRLPQHMVAGFMLLHMQGEQDDRSVTPYFVREKHSGNMKNPRGEKHYAPYKNAWVCLRDSKEVQEQLIDRMVKTMMLVQHQLLAPPPAALAAAEHK